MNRLQSYSLTWPSVNSRSDPVAFDEGDRNKPWEVRRRRLKAAAGLIIGHGTFLPRGDFSRYVETAACISDGTPMAWIEWDAVVAALDGGRLPASGGENRIVRLAASLAAGHLVSLRDAIPGLDQCNVDLVTTAIQRAARR